MKQQGVRFLGSLALMSLLVPAHAEEESKFNMGVLLHTYGTLQQKGYGSSVEADNSDKFDLGASVYRGRFMADMHITPKDYVFFETELTASVGLGADKAASIKMLDMQYDHTFANWLTVSAGKMLVSHNRNGLQTASTLMANDFTYFQYPYNMSSGDPLQNDCGRDVGVNFSGAANKFGYRLGLFGGRRDFEGQDKAPLRTVGRAIFNFCDADKYSGTNLGEGKTSTIGAGFDTQGSYSAFGADYYFDYPLSEKCQITLNTAFSHLNGGSASAKYSFASMIPEQNIYFAELGFYFKESKIQPWAKWERQDIKGDVKPTDVVGAGLNWFFNGYRTNVRLSWQGMSKETLLLNGTTDKKMYNQIWLQLQLCTF
ncbi:MAG: hypothetical protein KBT22_03870 [Bacteroidales bacterium]|nr:hypothetical protein [Candidatus Scybalocola fimicaballi]